MALQIKVYTLPNGDILNDVYLKIQKIISTSEDYEFLENVDESEHIKVTWLPKQKNELVAYIWADEIARRNQAAILHFLTGEFEYDMNSVYNIYEQAYQQINKIKFNNEGVNV
jgi:hypothetical protein